MNTARQLGQYRLIIVGMLLACVTVFTVPQASHAKTYYRTSRIVSSTLLPNGVVIANAGNRYGWRNQRRQPRCRTRYYRRRPSYRINQQIVPGIRTGINLNRNPGFQISRRGFGSYASPRFSSWRSAF